MQQFFLFCSELKVLRVEHFLNIFLSRKYYTKKGGSILAQAVPDTIILELDQRSLHCPAMYDVKDAFQVPNPALFSKNYKSN
jgi:hypothetical protein